MINIELNHRHIGVEHPTYFIAEIGSNHDGDLQRAKALIHLAAEAGADAAKFQNFTANKIVSDYGFQHLAKPLAHQSSWQEPVFQVYQEASLPFDWIPVLKAECDKGGVHYFSSPYDFAAVDELEPFVPAYKIGSGEIDWIEALEYIASKGKPVILSTGASTIGEVQRAVHSILTINPQLVLMQCNTSYTGSAENFKHIHLNVLRTYATMFPEVVLGLSDHTPGHATCLGAVALGARMIEKHFTDDPTREGPDHFFAMSPGSFRTMVERTRELEQALGVADKFVTENEKETSLIQRRCLRAGRDIEAGEILTREIVDVLRPVTPGAILPPDLPLILGARAATNIPKGEALYWSMVSFTKSNQ